MRLSDTRCLADSSILIMRSAVVPDSLQTPLTALPNTCDASLAIAKVEPLRLSQFPGDFVRYNKYNCELPHFCLV